jgi:peroxiredoxin
VEAWITAPASGSAVAYEGSFFLEADSIELVVPANVNQRLTITGSASQKEKDSLLEQQSSYESDITVLTKELENVEAGLAKDSTSTVLAATKIAINKHLDELRAGKTKIEQDFILQHPESFLSPVLLAFHFEREWVSLDSAQLLLNGFSSQVNNSFPGKRLAELLQGRKQSQVGKTAPDFEATDYNGNIFRLSSLKKKNVVILDFWASWCVPCRQISPTLKNFYEQYKDRGLAVVGISWDFDKNSWRKAVEKDSIGHWTQIYGFEPPNDGYRTMYSIPSIPMLILIDKEGVIVGRYNGLEKLEEMEAKLQEIFE